MTRSIRFSWASCPSHQGISQYRDFAVYGNYLFVVADNPTQHGLRVFDLTDLRNVQSPRVTFSEAAHYAGFVAGHSLWMDEETGFLYVYRTVGDFVWQRRADRERAEPVAAHLCWLLLGGPDPLSTGECLVYDGPDHDYHGHEMCFVGSDDNVTIVDVTNKSLHR